MQTETLFGIDYPSLWYLVVGVLFTGYAILDGFDFGAGALHLFIKGEKNRRIALNAIGPVWDGNEVWLVIGGGALFAGFPVFYATFLSSMYIPFMLFLLFIIFRAISIEFRSKEPYVWWRTMWDIFYSVSSIALAFLLGILMGNVLQGIAIGKNHEYQGGVLLDFINPYALMVGFTTLSLFMIHGTIYLLLKTEGKLYEKLTFISQNTFIFFIISFSTTTLYTLIYIPHLSDLFKSNNLFFIIPFLAILCIANIPRLIVKKRYRIAFIFSSLTIAFMLLFVGVELYPNLLLSTIDSDYNINIYNAASSHKSLGIMLVICAIGAPLVLAYTVFVYYTFKGKVELDEHSY